ncbi:CBASS cGAMP-activated phospholipase [Rhodanobacter denitrificans]|uniref:Patatin n=1 Tax=Rhodanobacter denitrificans TaxID=666685 RepID=M4NDS6_9GAMM|nr:CBASS cGAMP-activated phospholipase [Rhodanobacter denitrificans]AGG88889.1 patatin [Rhodanobacter denitrificans]ODT92416.1 MAG: patatin [Rhodanobacter sp. SCN 67-45]ODV27288.1 MAG: patatin [Rhodanobacter sp. SCN 68-63]UJM88011.1 patatin-like phospholipase family protein [Rhodanobacter denitrificans]
MSTSAVAIGQGSERPPNQRFQILALSGGGYRGLYTAKILADLEQHIGAPIGRHFDLIAGTSIGGILALAVALEIPAERMVTLFERHGEAIFRRRWSLRGIVRAPYSQAPLAALLAQDDLFGDRRLEACLHPVLVPTINYSTGLPVLFKTPHHPNFSRDFRYQLIDVALATSAAPAYFPRHVFDHRQYIDGGLFANAPGLLALHEAQHFLGRPREDICLVAIGTMSARFTVDPRRNRSGGTYDWGGWHPAETPKRLFGVAISAQESLVHHLLGHQLAPGQYFHVDDDLTDARARAVALDKANAAAREVLLGVGAERAKWCLGDPAFRTVLQHSPIAPRFYHGIHAHHEEGVARDAVTA